jgi:hypothetical protein
VGLRVGGDVMGLVEIAGEADWARTAGHAVQSA